MKLPRLGLWYETREKDLRARMRRMGRKGRAWEEATLGGEQRDSRG